MMLAKGYVIWIIVALVSGLVCWIIAKKKGRNPALWFAAGIGFNVVSLLCIALLKDLRIRGYANGKKQKA